MTYLLILSLKPTIRGILGQIYSRKLFDLINVVFKSTQMQINKKLHQEIDQTTKKMFSNLNPNSQTLLVKSE